MGRYRGPKNRIARRFGANIFGRTRNPMLHKQNPPGVQTQRRRKKSDYGLQLDEQQKLKASYGMISQKQLIRYYKEAVRRPGKTADNLIRYLECRLDNMVYKMKMAPTIFAAHQLVAHGHIQVDGKKVDRRSFQVKPGMTISIREKAQKMPIVKEASANVARETPEYIELHGPFEGKLAIAPELDQVQFPLPLNVAAICDFLAHRT